MTKSYEQFVLNTLAPGGRAGDEVKVDDYPDTRAGIQATHRLQLQLRSPWACPMVNQRVSNDYFNCPGSL